MYNIDTQKVSKVSYATFDIHKFQLKLMLLAGQPVPPDFPTCSDSYCGGHLHHPDNLDDDALAETCCGGQIVLDLPCSFFPEYKHGWRVQCHSTQSRKNGPTRLIVLFDKYHGPLTALPKDMRNYNTQPKETVFEISPPSSGQDFSLRHALRLTYPTCTTMADVTQASAQSKGIFPSHPAVTFAQAAYTDPDLF
jgi:hypothetical protein